MVLTASTSPRCLSAPRSGFAGNTAALRPVGRKCRPTVQRYVSANAAAIGDPLPSPEKRVIMNWLLVASAGLSVAGLAGPYVYFFVPPSVGGGGDSIPAKDAEGNDVKASKWVEKHRPNDRSLTQGLKSDATYLIVTENKEIERYGLNAVCTHLGCVVPWSTTDNKFKCPCHGSQYNSEGKVVRGPAPLSLALAHTEIKDDIVFFSPWKEQDFRTGKDPWWS